MPKHACKKIPVIREVFDQVLKKKKSSIRKLGAEKSITCTEKTIRRELKSGGLREQYIDQIARFLDVDSRLLTGELVRKTFETKEKFFLYLLENIDYYPYFRGEHEKMNRENMSETIKRILSLFQISYEQFSSKDFDEQCEFQQDLFTAILPVIYKYFDEDGYGDTEMLSCRMIIEELEAYREDYYAREYADKELREKYLKRPPLGYTREKIKKMSAEDIIDLNMELTGAAGDKEKEDYLTEKYKHYHEEE